MPPNAQLVQPPLVMSSSSGMRKLELTQLAMDRGRRVCGHRDQSRRGLSSSCPSLARMRFGMQQRYVPHGTIASDAACHGAPIAERERRVVHLHADRRPRDARARARAPQKAVVSLAATADRRAQTFRSPSPSRDEEGARPIIPRVRRRPARVSLETEYGALRRGARERCNLGRGAGRCCARRSGDRDAAFARWKQIVESSPTGGTAWYEARIEQVKLLLADGDKAQACEVIRLSLGKSTTTGGRKLPRQGHTA